MSNPIKMGKLSDYKTCAICNKEVLNYAEFESYWLCKTCASKLKFKIGDLVWFLKYNKDLDKLEVLCGAIRGYHYRRINTYKIEHNQFNETSENMYVNEEYIFPNKEECVAYGNKIGEVASDLQVQDLHLMKKQNKLYKQISNFLKSSEAIQFGVTGIDVKVENGYVNAEWKFGKRDINDIK